MAEGLPDFTGNYGTFDTGWIAPTVGGAAASGMPVQSMNTPMSGVKDWSAAAMTGANMDAIKAAALQAITSGSARQSPMGLAVPQPVPMGTGVNPSALQAGQQAWQQQQQAYAQKRQQAANQTNQLLTVASRYLV